MSGISDRLSVEVTKICKEQGPADALACLTITLAGLIRFMVSDGSRRALTDDELKECLHLWSVTTQQANQVFSK
ncbi:MAG: hypothetical protein ACR2RF_05375 [Geminicoccaceae bacterium]